MSRKFQVYGGQFVRRQRAVNAPGITLGKEGKTVERIKSLNRCQKGILILMIVMSMVFLAVYSATISRVGFEYKDTILVPTQENGSTVYSGKIRGQQARFTVSEDKTVIFQCGDRTFGPYTAKEDPTAIPRDEETAEYMTGVELLQGDSILFRGGVLETSNGYWLYNEDGTLNNFRITFVSSDGIERDENGNAVDPVEPSAATILNLMKDPKLTHKGEWIAWFGAVFFCALNALSILFADELFRWNLRFQIRDADCAEPSDWEIAGRYISWTVLAIMALAVFLTGLQ